MLVITRGCGQGLMVGAHRVVVLGIGASEVILRVEASREVEIESEETGGFARRRQVFFTLADDPATRALLIVRRRSEGIRIAGDVVVMVADIRGDKTRLGITAPPACVVVRDEVYHRMYGHWPKAGVPTLDPRNGGITREEVLVSLGTGGENRKKGDAVDLAGAEG